MANTEVKASPSLGANDLPSPSPSTASAAPVEDASTQPLSTISSAYYQALADLNRGFEQDARNLKLLKGFHFFPAEEVKAWANRVSRLQTEASLRLLESLRDRLMNNVLYYDQSGGQRGA